MVNTYEEIDRLVRNNRRMYLNKNLYLMRDNWEDTFVTLRHRTYGNILIYHPDRILILQTIDPNRTTLRKLFVDHIPDMYKARNFDGILMVYNEDHKHLRIPVAQGTELSWTGFCRNNVGLEPAYLRTRRYAKAKIVYRILTDNAFKLRASEEPCFICGGRTEDGSSLMEHMGLKYHIKEHLESQEFVPEMLLEALYSYCGSHRSWDRETYSAARAVVTYRGSLTNAPQQVKEFLADAWVYYIDEILGVNLRE